METLELTIILDVPKDLSQRALYEAIRNGCTAGYEIRNEDGSTQWLNVAGIKTVDPNSLETDEYQKVAQTMMEHIAYDNGFVHRDAPMHYPEGHITRITNAARVFFKANPEMLTDEFLVNICVGMTDDIEAQFGHLTGYQELNAALGDYLTLKLPMRKMTQQSLGYARIAATSAQT